MSALTFDAVAKSYDGRSHAVDGFTLDIRDGELVVLLGPSGCGKTTLLRMTAGLEDITRGTISISGRIVNQAPPQARDVAMVFQNYALYPHMSVYENMAFAPTVRGLKATDIDWRVRDAASTLGIAELLHRRPRELSGGQRQRVALGRAVVRAPKTLLLDEPLSNLDARLRVSMRAEIRTLHQRMGMTTLFVTHDQDEAMMLADRVAVMCAGRLQQVGTPLEVYRKPSNRFVAEFMVGVGNSATNFFEGRLILVPGGVVFDDGSTDADGRAYRMRVSAAHTATLTKHAGKPVIMALRPQSFIEQPPVARAEDEVAWRTWRVPVGRTELLGDCVNLHATTGRTPFAARVPTGTSLGPGSTVSLSANMDEAMWFEAGEFGKNLLT